MRLHHLGLLLIMAGLLILYYVSNEDSVWREGHLTKYHRTEYQNILFLKTHKCGSSTVQNILLRYGYLQNLNFVLPPDSNYLGHPKKFQESMIPKEIAPESNKYNIFTHHTRYDYHSIKRSMNDDVVFTTILRNPISLFESLYSYYDLQNYYGRNIHDLLKIFPSRYIKHKSRYAGKLGINQMSFDLGFDEQDFNNNKSLIKFVKKINSEFDLVMISEYMEASLVLLSELMNWPLTHVQYIPLNKRTPHKKTSLTQKEQQAILELNQADLFIYEFFLKEFWTRILKYGVDKMVANVKKLVALNNSLYMRCVGGENTKGFGNTTSYYVKNTNDWLCKYSTMNELNFTDEIRNYQRSKAESVKNLLRLTSSGGSQWGWFWGSR